MLYKVSFEVGLPVAATEFIPEGIVWQTAFFYTLSDGRTEYVFKVLEADSKEEAIALAKELR